MQVFKGRPFEIGPDVFHCVKMMEIVLWKEISNRKLGDID